MTYHINTRTDLLCRGQDRPGGVSIATSYVTAALAPEDSLTQLQAVLGSRTAGRAGHGGVGGWNQHHLSTRPLASLDQLSLDATDGRIGGFAGHPGLAQESRPEILDGDHLVVGDHTVRPDPGSVLRLTGRLLVNPGDLSPGPLVALAGLLSWPGFTPSHLPLRPGQLGSAPGSMTSVGQIIGRIGGRRGDPDAPVNANGGGRSGRFRSVSPNHEAGVPVTKTVSGHPYTGWLTRQVSGPHDRNADAFGQSQSTLADRKPARKRVLQGRQRLIPPLVGRSTPASNAERSAQGGGVGPQHLLLSVLGSISQPGILFAGSSQHLGERGKGWPAPSSLLVDRFIPQPPTATPLVKQRTLCCRAGAQTIAVAHGLSHESHPRPSRQLFSSSKATDWHPSG